KYIGAFKNLPPIVSYYWPSSDDLEQSSQALALQWLQVAQEKGGGGFAHSFHFAHGWLPAYPETTGYIVETLLKMNDLPEAQKMAKRALDWLISVQQDDGSFHDLARQPQVFDVGQILLGFNQSYEHAAQPEIKQAIEKSADWLVSVQEDDGAFRRAAYLQRPHTYYSRVGWALIWSGQILEREDWLQAGRENLDWVVSQQQANGFFAHASFDDAPAFLHNIVYVLEGLLEGHIRLGEESWLSATHKLADALLSVRDSKGLLVSQYSDDLRPVRAGEYCMTGLAQWAGLCFDLWHEGGNEDYMTAGKKALAYLKDQQIKRGHSYIKGALPGSVPISGAYLRFAFPNWGVKFFLDALQKEPKQA
ncbi:MAG: prenyltransferase/squalene oxidase repeat-containing protein, partial [Pseudomonadota bacterium]